MEIPFDNLWREQLTCLEKRSRFENKVTAISETEISKKQAKTNVTFTSLRLDIQTMKK